MKNTTFLNRLKGDISPSWDHPWKKQGLLAIELAKQRLEEENGVIVLTGNGEERNNPAITPV